MIWNLGWQTWQATKTASVDVFCAGDPCNGPTLLVTGGVHGDEYEGPLAIARLAQELDGQHIDGRVILVPVVNPHARHSGSRCTVEDGLNLARCFPGNPHGAETERLASAVFQHLVEVSDYVLDLHSGGVEYRFWPVAGFYGEVETRNPSYAAAKAFGLPSLWQLPETPGVLSSEARKAGKIVAGFEYLGAGQLSPEGVDSYVSGIKRCLAHWGIMAQNDDVPGKQRCFSGDWLMSKCSGIFISMFELGDDVAGGDVLARIEDVRGKTMQEFVAPTSGVILGLRSKAYIEADAWGVLLGQELDLV